MPNACCPGCTVKEKSFDRTMRKPRLTHWLSIEFATAQGFRWSDVAETSGSLRRGGLERTVHHGPVLQPDGQEGKREYAAAVREHGQSEQVRVDNRYCEARTDNISLPGAFLASVYMNALGVGHGAYTYSPRGCVSTIHHSV